MLCFLIVCGFFEGRRLDFPPLFHHISIQCLEHKWSSFVFVSLKWGLNFKKQMWNYISSIGGVNESPKEIILFPSIALRIFQNRSPANFILHAGHQWVHEITEPWIDRICPRLTGNQARPEQRIWRWVNKEMRCQPANPL